MGVFARIMDRNSNYGSSISAELSQLSLNNISAKSAYQQIANGVYRLTELAGLAAKGINP